MEEEVGGAEGVAKGSCDCIFVQMFLETLAVCHKCPNLQICTVPKGLNLFVCKHSIVSCM